MQPKRLLLRLSSIGDIILATTALEVPELTNTAPSFKVDWVVAQEFKELLEGHPRIGKLWQFKRSSGRSKWIELCRKLWEERYTEIFDLHRSLRTRLMWILFRFWSIRENQPMPRWKTVSKQRTKLYLYYLLKAICPKNWRPDPWVVRFSRAVGGSGKERPNLTHLLSTALSPEVLQIQKEAAAHPGSTGRSYICIMPSSRWDGKKWSVEHYFELVQKLPYFPVILGRENDLESLQLVEKLKERKLPFYSGVGNWNFQQTSRVLKSSAGYLGADTGLAHLAEAVGVSAKIIFGPTSPDMGFGPWRKESRSFGLDLACRPCGKDGRWCYRVFQRHHCLKGLSVEKVLRKWEGV